MRSSDTINIVQISQEHIESFRNALDAVAKERKYLALVEAPPPREAEEFILNNKARGAIQFAALDRDQVVGWCSVIAPDIPGFRHNGRLGIGVIRESRHKGIGKGLLKKAIELCKTRGITRTELEGYSSKIPARELFRKFGFESEGRKTRAR